MKREHWENFLRLNGIEYSIQLDPDWYPDVDGEVVDVHSYIRIDEGDRKVSGYGGFYTAVLFDANGEFIGIGAWE
jgi:hypothetical protein